MTTSSLIALLPTQGSLTKTSWELPQSMTEGDWRAAGNALSQVDGAMNWWLGDWWRFGEHKYGDRKSLVESDEWSGPSWDQCRAAGSISGIFESARRRAVVPFGHHREVSSLPIAECDQLLDWCESEFNKTGNVPTRIVLREKVKQVKAWLAQGWTQSQLERRKLLESGQAVVASKRNDESGKPLDAALIAWADQQGLMVPIDRNTDWGNPFEMPSDGDRDTVCENYANHYLPYKPSLQKKLKNLTGKVLVCWCHPERCHGDHLAKLVNEV